MALRLKYAGIDAELEVDRDLGRSLDAAVASAAGRARVRAAHLHGAARAARPAGPPRAREAVVGVTAPRRDLARRGVRLLRRRPAAVARARARPRDGPMLDLGAGTGRVALDLAGARPRARRARLRPELLRRARPARAERGLRVDACAADARAFELGRRFALAIAPMQVVQLLGGPDGACLLGACARTCARRARSPPRSPTLRGGAAGRDALPPAPRRARAGRLGPLQPAGRGAPRSRAAWPWTACARPSRPPASSTEERHTIALDYVSPDELEAEARAAGLEPVGRRAGARDRATTWAARWSVCRRCASARSIPS